MFTDGYLTPIGYLQFEAQARAEADKAWREYIDSLTQLLVMRNGSTIIFIDTGEGPYRSFNVT